MYSEALPGRKVVFLFWVRVQVFSAGGRAFDRVFFSADLLPQALKHLKSGFVQYVGVLQGLFGGIRGG